MVKLNELIRVLRGSKVSPTKRITSLRIQSTKLQQRESKFKGRANKAREAAKEALRNGDERAYQRHSSKYTSNRKALETTENIHDVTLRLVDLMEMSKDLNDIVGIGASIGDMQSEIGIDTHNLENAMSNIVESMMNVESSAKVISSTIDAVLNTGDEVSIDQEGLRNELLSEIQFEVSDEDDLLSEIEKERNKDE